MMGYNRVIMVGNLTRDPDLKQFDSGQNLCKLGIAVNRQYRNKATGDMQQEVCYVDVDVWGAQAEPSHKYLQKGRPVLIEGRLKLDTWETPEGYRRSKHSIVADRVQFLSAGATDQQSTSDHTSSPHQASSSQHESNEQQGVSFQDEQPFEDDLPF